MARRKSGNETQTQLLIDRSIRSNVRRRVSMFSTSQTPANVVLEEVDGRPNSLVCAEDASTHPIDVGAECSRQVTVWQAERRGRRGIRGPRRRRLLYIPPVSESIPSHGVTGPVTSVQI